VEVVHLRARADGQNALLDLVQKLVELVARAEVKRELYAEVLIRLVWRHCSV
jgi:hypothetical protein